MKSFAAISLSRKIMLACGLALACLHAFAQDADPPGRVARLNLLQGTVSQLPAGENDWGVAEPNRPLTTGDRLWTEPGARAELHSGSTAVRLDGQSSLEISALDDNVTRLTLSQGSLNLRVRNLYPGEQMEIDTPNLALTVQQPGSYRLDVDPANGTTRVAVRYGNATVYGENAEAVPLTANGQQLVFSGRNLSRAGPPQSLYSDPFDSWAMARDKAEDDSISARYVSRETIGYQQLDAYGDWRNDTTYGAIWIPRNIAAQWAPYRYGQWRWIPPWGWTWVDDAPWGFAPFHYGRWTQVGPQWAWVPGPRAPRPVYAPALVGFLGGQQGNTSWNIAVGPDRRPGPGIGWFPLAPGEAWRPGYRASPRYIEGINRGESRDRGRRDDRSGTPPAYFFQRQPGAVTAVPQAEFGHGPAWRPGNRPRLGDADLAGAQILPTPSVPGGRPGWPGGQRPQGGTAPSPQTQVPGQDARPMLRPQMRPDAMQERQPDRRPDARPEMARPDAPREGAPGGRPAFPQQNQAQPSQPPGGVPPAAPPRGPLVEQAQRLQQQQQQQQEQAQRPQPQPQPQPQVQPQRQEPPRLVQQQSDLVRREQQAQQERSQRDQAQREQIQREQNQREQQVRQQQNQQAMQEQQRAQQAQQAQQQAQQNMQREQLRNRQELLQRQQQDQQRQQEQQQPRQVQQQQQQQQQQRQPQPQPGADNGPAMDWRPGRRPEVNR